MKLSSLIDLFISDKDLISYRQHATLTAKSFPTFLFLNVLLYFGMTLIFLEALSWPYHAGFGLGLLIICLATALLIERADREMQTSAHLCMAWILFGGSLIFIWWQVYFVILLRTNNLFYLQEYITILSMAMFLWIATIGRFTRPSSFFVIATSLVMVSQLLLTPFFGNKTLTIQLLLTALGELFFLRILNAHITRLLSVEGENSELLEALQQKNLALEQANHSQSRYLSAASHDLRQPLHALALLTNDVQRKNTEPKITGQLKKMELAIDSLSQSFNAILNLSRLDAGVVTPNLKYFPIQNLFNRLNIEYADVAFGKKLSLTIRPSKLWVLSDENMLYSILSNFVSNALRYTETGGVLIGTRPGSEGKFKITVYDSGSGVPSEKARQIFQEYQRLDEAQQRVKGGVGLGLAIAERTARLLNEKLWVKSTLGKGSAFGLMLTSVTADVKETIQPTPLHNVLSNKRVAIIDDDEWALDSLQDLLLDWEMDVSLILSSDMLTEIAAAEGPFDFIISDYHLGTPNETGLDLIRVARELSPEKPPICLILTGDTRSELAQEAEAAGVHLWHKPIRPARLRSYLSDLTQQRNDL